MTPPPTPSAGGPAALLASAAAVLTRVTSFHVSGMYDPGLSIDLTVSGGEVHGTVTTHGVTWEETAVNGQAYVRGAALWSATLPQRAAVLGDAWVEVDDPSAGYGAVAVAANIRRALAIVVFGAHPGLAPSGTATVSGLRAIELSGATDIYDIADGPTPYPLRWLDRDDVAANGQPCGVTLSDFDVPATITVPVATGTVTAPPSPTTP